MKFHVEQWVSDERERALTNPGEDLLRGLVVVALGMLAFWSWLA